MLKNEDKDILLIEKNPGETMGELTKRVRQENNLAADEKITFAGRLDPMASGLVIFLSGPKRFSREEFLALPKKYDFEIILGMTTDTNDALGLVEEIGLQKNDFSLSGLEKIFAEMKGEREQTYPAYSSKHVDGRALFSYARGGEEIPVVKRTVEIFSLDILEVIEVQREDWLTEIFQQIDSVKGDFRQAEIRARWENVRKELPEKIKKISSSVSCSSGTYVRVIAKEIGEKLGTKAIAHNIHRTEIGRFTKEGIIV